MQKSAEDDEGSEDSTDWGSDSESDTDSSDDETQYASVRERFLKRLVFGVFRFKSFLLIFNLRHG
jgi:hypothetical protein